ncbi:phosphoheptose isomerase [Congregibacter variabilis]|uniref:Phosphoheptose isomerase n=1 Tax=Congregibacter variabilis TaxID=3081200 RepID=A0ABZ0I932_9GAMM|nr:phosphoheptose isomerase [Congregibacter sp. IMCC43200]
MTDQSYESIAASFHRRIDAIAGAVDSMAPGLEAATTLLTQAVLEDRKVLVCGCKEDATLAAHVAAILRTPPEPGPALPALAFCSDIEGGGDQMWRDLRTLSRDGDILLCIDSRPGAALAYRAVEFAEKRNLVTIAMSETVRVDGVTCIELHTEDSDLRSELILMSSHCLQEQIKQILLGE